MIPCIFCSKEFENVERLRLHSSECVAHPLWKQLASASDRLSLYQTQLKRVQNERDAYLALLKEGKEASQRLISYLAKLNATSF